MPIPSQVACIGKDFDIDFSLDGTSTGVPFQGRLGFAGDVGMIHAFNDAWNLAFAVRVTRMSYDVSDVRIKANSVGLVASINYDL